MSPTSDISRVLAAGTRQSAREGRVVLHSLPIGYTLDDARGVRDPRGMLASRFGVDMHVVTADMAPARNLMLAVERCHLLIEALVAGSYVASLATLADDEADLGAAVIDMGAGTTSLAVFADGRFIHADGFALGGRHVTLDIARGLNTNVHDSERIKTLYGSVLAGGADERDMISVTALSGDEREPSRSVSRAMLTRIIKPRVEEILEIVRDRLAASPFAAEPRGRVILTGGACQLTGLPELAIQILGRPVRVGRPLGISGLPEAAKGPAFAAAAGLLVYPQAAHHGTLRTAPYAATHDRDRRLHRSGRTMATGKLLTIGTSVITYWPRPGRRHSAVDPARAPEEAAMSINLKIPDIRELKPRITVFGVGGAGGNAVNNMINAGLQGVDFVVANTDAQALTMSRAERIIQMGVQATEGLGAGSQPDVGRAAAEEVIDEIRDHLTGAHMVFVTAGMGGGTGTGASPVVARAARELGILTVGVVTKPFHFEGQRRMRLAESGIMELQKSVDTLIIIPNQNLFRVANEKTTFADAFAMADQVLYSGVACITDLMVKEGLINLDFADVRAVMREMGKAMMGTGEASGDKRALRSAEAAISNPLIDDVSMRGARGLLISITGGKDLTLYEVDEAATRIREEVDADANIIVGATFDESLDGIIRVSVVATGVDINAAHNARSATSSHPPAQAPAPPRRVRPCRRRRRCRLRVPTPPRPPMSMRPESPN